MKKVTLILSVVLTMLLVSCGNSNSKNEQKKEKTTQAITQSNIIGEWKCVDISNGVTHMKSIAKMQAHIVFDGKNKISSKMKLPDGSFAEQKIGTYKIENGKIVSSIYEVNPYMENNQLIIEDPSADNKQIYEKIK